jgi:outer membrane immunogenic protein
MVNKLLVFGVALFALPGLASAADMPLKAPLPVPVATWSGCYIGGHAGVASSHFSDRVSFDDVNLPFGGPPEFLLTNHYNTHGFAGGGQGGCQLQRGILVFGLEGDWTSAHQSQQTFFAEAGGPDTATTGVTLDSLWSVRARAGVTATDNLFLYGTLGVGGANYKYNFTLFDADSNTNTANLSINRAGFVGGVGAEYRLWSNVIVGVDYLHYFVSNDFMLPVTTGPGTSGPTNGDRVNLSGVDVVRARVSYLFNWW